MVNNIKLERIKHNKKQSDIAKYLGINVNTYGKKEREPSEVTLKEAKMLSILYKCTIDYLAENI